MSLDLKAIGLDLWSLKQEVQECKVSNTHQLHNVVMEKLILTFVPSGLDINGFMLSYFEGTTNLQCYTGCTLTT